MSKPTAHLTAGDDDTAHRDYDADADMLARPADDAARRRLDAQLDD